MTKVNQLNWTKDHSKFNLLSFNREVDFKRVDVIKEVIKKNGFLVPILVNQNFYVVDGQHRLEAAKKLNVEFSYMIYEIDDSVLPIIVSQLNSSSKTWKLRDYFYMWVDQRKENYLYIEELLKKFSIPFEAFWRIAYFTFKGYSDGTLTGNFKDGTITFTSNQKAKAEERLKNMKDIMSKEKRFQEFGLAFTHAAIKAVVNKKYNHEFMMKALGEDPGCLLKAKTCYDFCAQLEDIYNRYSDCGKNNRIKIA